MAGRVLRGAVVGASTMLGKELAEELNNSAAAWDLTLLDAPDAGGQIMSAGDEALMIQPVSADAFLGMDVVFFAGDAATTQKFWKAAHAVGTGIVDVTGVLEDEPGVVVRSPWIENGVMPDIATVAVVAMHPVAAVLALMETRLKPLGVKRIVATVMLPASELGSAGVDELHQQTVGLLTFKSLPKDVYDAQVAFNLVAALGGEAKINLEHVQETIQRQVGGRPGVLALQVVQAPVFHGYTASIFVELSSEADETAVRRALQGGVLKLADETAPSNESVAGSDEMLVSVRRAVGVHQGNGFWIWMAGDNMRLAVKNAAVCALELAGLQSASGVN